MKELVNRRNHLDTQIAEKIETIDALKQAMQFLKHNPNIRESTFRLLEDNKLSKQNRLEDLQFEWNMIDGACKELEKKNNIVQ